MAPQRDEILKTNIANKKIKNIAEVHRFSCNSVMEFSEYLQ